MRAGQHAILIFALLSMTVVPAGAQAEATRSTQTAIVRCPGLPAGGPAWRSRPCDGARSWVIETTAGWEELLSLIGNEPARRPADHEVAIAWTGCITRHWDTALIGLRERASEVHAYAGPIRESSLHGTPHVIRHMHVVVWRIVSRPDKPLILRPWSDASVLAFRLQDLGGDVADVDAVEDSEPPIQDRIPAGRILRAATLLFDKGNEATRDRGLRWLDRLWPGLDGMERSQVTGLIAALVNPHAEGSVQWSAHLRLPPILGHLAPIDPSALEPLRAALGRNHRDEIAAVCMALQRAGPAGKSLAVPLIEAIVESAIPGHRPEPSAESAVFAMGPEIDGHLLPLLRSESIDVRLMGLRLCQRFGLRAAAHEEAVLEILRQDPPEAGDLLPFEAATTLAAIAPASPRVRQTLVSMAFKAGESLGSHLCRVVRMLRPHPESSAEVVTLALADPDRRRRALEVIEALGVAPESAHAGLEAALTGEDFGTSRAAARALAEIGPGALPILARGLEAADSRVRTNARVGIQLMGERGQALAPHIAGRLGSGGESPSYLMLTLVAMGKSGCQTLAMDLERRLQSRDDGRLEVILSDLSALLSNPSHRDAPGLGDLTRIAQGLGPVMAGHPQSRVRWQACRILGSVPAFDARFRQPAEELLRQLTADPAPLVREAAAEALRQLP